MRNMRNKRHAMFLFKCEGIEALMDKLNLVVAHCILMLHVKSI